MHKLAITKRDEALFLYLFQNKIASFKQIRRDLFHNIAIQTVYRRTGKLRKGGWIEVTPYMHGKKVSSYFGITKKCFDKKLKKHMEVRHGPLKSDSIIHDLRLNDIRGFFLSKKAVSSYFTENELVTNS